MLGSLLNINPKVPILGQLTKFAQAIRDMSIKHFVLANKSCMETIDTLDLIPTPTLTT